MDAPGPVAARVKPGARVPVISPATGRYYCGLKGLPRAVYAVFFYFPHQLLLPTTSSSGEQTREKKKTGLASNVVYSAPARWKFSKILYAATRRRPENAVCRITRTNIVWTAVFGKLFTPQTTTAESDSGLVYRFPVGSPGTFGSREFRKTFATECQQQNAVFVRYVSKDRSTYTRVTLHRGNENTDRCKTDRSAQNPKSALVSHTVTSLRAFVKVFNFNKYIIFFFNRVTFLSK